MGVIGSRPRWRIGLAPAPVRVPPAGWIALEWAPQISVEPVPLDERVPQWETSRGAGVPVTSPARLLALATLPMLRIRRPRDRTRAAESADRLIAALDPNRTMGDVTEEVQKKGLQVRRAGDDNSRRTTLG